MILLFAGAFLAGILTILAPCIAPVVPLVLGAASTGGRRRSVGILAGFGLSFLAVTVVLASALAAAGLTTARLRIASAVFLGLVGLTIALPGIGFRLGERLTPLADLGARVARSRPGNGVAGGLVLGGAIGLVWAPCVGPIMAGVIAAAAVRGPGVESLLIASAYVAGAALPLALVAHWGSRATVVATGLTGRGRLRRAFGVVMLGSALLVLSGQDVAVENRLAAFLPTGLGGGLAGVEQQPAIQRALDALRTDRSPAAGTSDPGSVAGVPGPGVGGTPAQLPAPVAEALPGQVALEDLGPAPDFAGIETWINSGPLSMTSLRGTVVLVEFWTFACINCIHVQPFVTAWHDRYASSGLVVIGVHTPELSFERDLGNVRDAVAKAGIGYPVAVDPAFATWTAYRNSYWPALYFIDRSGRIRHVHYGEGDYGVSEQVIRELLAAPS